ncbi:metal/formaldehyde-sensitive transcriptional repressor [Erwinia pyri]|uniref:Metal/formaldehyde-sensitive transcriptional repressor n=1 Tax=Erwinia pyri TaxID=3062598 RepID=A0AA50DKR1_9GAMM|nr:metal/formaldehyde-sensitive transcriptional repressor [Erwinia sp. DE2]WLS79557.1 metal/formaldehyde-sensitive transcriptional repressor [Erwinia sp. DE2]
MPHSPEDKKRALNRIKRIQGQCEGIQRSLEAGADCTPILQQIASARGAMTGLMTEILESYIRDEFVKPGEQAPGDEEIAVLLSLVRSYTK